MRFVQYCKTLPAGARSPTKRSIYWQALPNAIAARSCDLQVLLARGAAQDISVPVRGGGHVSKQIEYVDSVVNPMVVALSLMAAR